MLDNSLPASIAQIVETIWSSTLNLPVAPSHAWLTALPEQRTFAGIVQISGAWDGAVALHCSEPLARRAAMAMLDLAEDSVTNADIQDTLGELANMSGGNVKALLPEPCVLGLPVVVEGADFRLRVPGSQQLLQCAFETDGEPFAITVLQRVPVGVAA